MSDMKDIMNTWRKTIDTINETTYSRILKKIEDMKVPFVVISGDRHEHSRNQNNKRNKNLKQAIKTSGYPFADLEGSWVEKGEDGEPVRVIEKSVIVYDEPRGESGEGERKELFELGKDLSELYEQDAFIFGEPGAKTNRMHINAYDGNGNAVEYGGPWSTLEKIPNDSDFWSRVRGTTFVFKEEGQKDILEVEAPNSFIEALCKANEHKGKNFIFVRKNKSDLDNS